MTAFYCKKLKTPPRFCLCLKQARQKCGIGLTTIARTTHIKTQYLQAIEECRLRDIPVAAVYIKRYIAAYAKAVGLSKTSDKLIESLGIENYLDDAAEREPSPNRAASCGRTAFINLPRLTRGLAVCALIFLFTIGMGTQWARFVRPPKLTIVDPPNDLVTTLPIVTIRGSAEKEATIHINGAPIQHHENGNFETDVPLEKGLNTIAVQATKKSGKRTTLIRTIVRDDAPDRLSLEAEARKP